MRQRSNRGMRAPARHRPDRGDGQHRHRDAARARDLPDLRNQRRPEAHDHRGQRRAAERSLRALRARPRSGDRRQRHRVGRGSARPSAQLLRPIPVLIEAGATANDPDTITVFYGGSSSLSTPVPFKQNCYASIPTWSGTGRLQPEATWSPRSRAPTCTMSTIDAGGVAVDRATGFATLTAHAGRRRSRCYVFRGHRVAGEPRVRKSRWGASRIPVDATATCACGRRTASEPMIRSRRW